MSKGRSDINSYKLTRTWFDFAMQNPDLVKSNHTALYTWLLELNNRLGWVEKFGITMREGMEGMSCKSRNTYAKCFNGLVEWGFVEVVKKSRNQHDCNTISLLNICATTDTTKLNSLRKKCATSDTTTSTSTDTIPQTNKPLNYETIHSSSSAREKEIDEAIKSHCQPEEEKEKNSAKKENVSFVQFAQHMGPLPTAEEANDHLNKHYPSLYGLIRKDNDNASTEQQRLELLKYFWEENADIYRMKMPPWADILKHFRNWVPRYTFIKSDKKNTNSDANTKHNTTGRTNRTEDKRNELIDLKGQSAEFLRRTAG